MCKCSFRSQLMNILLSNKVPREASLPLGILTLSPSTGRSYSPSPWYPPHPSSASLHVSLSDHKTASLGRSSSGGTVLGSGGGVQSSKKHLKTSNLTLIFLFKVAPPVDGSCPLTTKNKK